MDLDALLTHYFGTSELGTIDPVRLTAGRDKLAVDFGIEREPGRRFALWALMDALGFAPPPADAFEDLKLRRAAEDYLTAAYRMERDA